MRTRIASPVSQARRARYVDAAAAEFVVRRARRRMRIWAGLVPAVVLTFGGIAAAHSRPGRIPYWPGSCLKTQPVGNGSLRLYRSDCTSPDATLQIASRAAGHRACPSRSYATLTDPAWTYCGMLHLRAGECFRFSPMQLIDCSSGPGFGQFRVAKVIAGTHERSACPSPSFGRVFSYPDPPSITCTEPIPEPVSGSMRSTPGPGSSPGSGT